MGEGEEPPIHHNMDEMSTPYVSGRWYVGSPGTPLC